MKRLIFLTLCFVIVSCHSNQQEDSMTLEQLEASFFNPPEDAKPWTWWHWANGNVTKEGITHDLENMKRAGLGGVLIFNTMLDMPRGTARFMNDEWLAMFDHAASECDRLGLIFGMHNSDGWSQSGGPWITPENSMKKLTWSMVRTQGPGRFSANLERPSTPVLDEHGRPVADLVKDFYRDIAVIAYPTPEGERVNGPDSEILVDGSLPAIELRNLFDNDPETYARFPLQSQDVPVQHSIRMQFLRPVTAQTLVLRGIRGFQPPQVLPGKLEVSDDGLNFREVASMDMNWCFRASPTGTITIAFPEATGKVFRLSFLGEHIFSNELHLSEVELSSASAVHYWEAKAGWVRVREHGGEAPFFARDPGPEYDLMDLPGNSAVSPGQVHVFRGELNDNGHFEWDVPDGNWTILRMGYTSTGKTLVQASEEGGGLECDKLDPRAVRFHLDHLIGKLADRYSEKNIRSFQVFETDSWEAGLQTWANDLDQRFQTATGQDLMKWLPLITEGVTIGSYEESDRFLWDWRRFLADQIIDNYYRVIVEFAEEKGLTYVAESSGRVAYMYDPIRYQRMSPVPMGEFWTGPVRGDGVRLDNKVAASAAHLTGRKFVATEAYTSRPQDAQWAEHPFTLKALGDQAFCEGVNKFVFHTYAHQPYPDLKPGFTMGRWGMHNHSGNTWWGRPVEAWFKYLARCQFMLQEGEFHADILAFPGSDVPGILASREDFVPVIPPGYDFDGCDFQALLDARVEDGIIVLPGGMRYKVILLPDKKKLLLEEVRRITELIREGAVVITPQLPTGSLGLQDMLNGDTEIQKLVREEWDGKIILAREHLEEVMNELNIPPDFSYKSVADQPDIRFIHRIIGGSDVYFLSNQEDHAVTFEASFRQPAGKKLSLWDPANGKKVAADLLNSTREGVSEATIHLDPYGSVFAVFSDTYPVLYPAIEEEKETTFRGPWSLKFSEGGGAPQEPLQLTELMDWSTHPDFNVRHFSGTAIYSTKWTVGDENLGKGMHVLLDLGQVHEMAQVLVNGQEAEMLWKPPFRTDITSLLTEGENSLEIKVTNLWPNRMIGDEHFPEEVNWDRKGNVFLPKEWPQWMIDGQPRPASPRITWTTRGRIYQKNDPLLPSGLLGPVKLIYANETTMNANH